MYDQSNDAGKGFLVRVGARPGLSGGTRCAESVNHLAGARRHDVWMPRGRLHQTPSRGGLKAPCSVNFEHVKVG